VRGADARSAQIGGPDSISQCFQVKTYSVEPLPASFCRNLFSKYDWRSALLNELVEDGPKVPLIGGTFSVSCVAEGLAGTGTCPHGAVIGPACATQGMAPYSDSGEEVTLGETHKVGCFNIPDAPFVHNTRCDVALLHQLSQPASSVGVDLVVVDGHSDSPR
jgi:hypothetical protein